LASALLSLSRLPKCHTAQTQEWLGRRQAEVLPVPYFHIVVTVPVELRAVLRAHWAVLAAQTMELRLRPVCK
jgi:hypothetical protein